MKDHTPPWRFGLYAAMILLGLMIAVTTTASFARNTLKNPGKFQVHHGVTNRGVLKRMNTMRVAKTAIETLADMMAGRVRFDRKVARAARKDLIAVTRVIPRIFKRRHQDRLSRARPEIWTRWHDFEARADIAERTARRLRTDRLGPLRKTLPDMINACLNCHQTYRKAR